MERYARHIVYRGYSGEGAREDEMFHVHRSFDTLREAIIYVDDVKGVGPYGYRVIDIEHIGLGDMLVASECRALVARIRASRVTA